MKLIEFSVKHSLFVNLLSVFLVVAGIVSLFSLKREAFPNVSYDMVTVSTVYRGASADEIINETDHCVDARDSHHEGGRRHLSARFAQVADAAGEQCGDDCARDARQREQIQQITRNGRFAEQHAARRQNERERGADHCAGKSTRGRTYVVKRHIGGAATARHELVQEIAGTQRESRPCQARKALKEHERPEMVRQKPQGRHDGQRYTGHEQNQPIPVDVCDSSPGREHEELHEDTGAGEDRELQVTQAEIAEHVNREERRGNAHGRVHERKVRREAEGAGGS